MIEICALLNTGGGVLLFNCVQQYLNIQPTGQRVAEPDKKGYIQAIKRGIKKIYPRVRLDKEIKVTFVPIAKYPYSNDVQKQEGE